MATILRDGHNILVSDLLKPSEFDPDRLERVSYRKVIPDVEVVESDPSWPSQFLALKEAIITALRPTVLAVNHTGSTSIPSLPAKPIIDIDLVLTSNTDEAAFVPQLEDAGFQLLFREPQWHEHRFFISLDTLPTCNLHVWGPGCPEVERHRIFRDWLLENKTDRELYRVVKSKAARLTREKGETTVDYNLRKQETIREILYRAFEALGYVE